MLNLNLEPTDCITLTHQSNTISSPRNLVYTLDTTVVVVTVAVGRGEAKNPIDDPIRLTPRTVYSIR